MTIGETEFTLLLKDGDFELRDYAPCVVAEVTVTGDARTAGNRGFRLLAGYISGGNARAHKIAMTAPVTRLPAGESIAMTAPARLTGGAESWRMRFTMPRGSVLADLPAPENPAVHLAALPAARFAVLRFSGLTGAARVAEHSARLLALAQARGLAPQGPVSLARYDPPWTPWFLRRNEVMFAVAQG